MKQGWEAFGDYQKLLEQFFRGMADMGAAIGLKQNATAPWGEALEQWSKLYSGNPAQHSAMFEQLLDQAKSYFGVLQSLFEQKGKLPGADELRKLVGDFAGRFIQQDPMHQWWSKVQPMLGALLPDLPKDFGEESLKKLLSAPAFGYAREHQERLQGFARAVLDFEVALRGYQQLIAKSLEGAVSVMQSKLADAAEPGGKPLQTPRQVYDLLIDALEEAYAEVALSAEFRVAYGKLVDAQMRLKSHVQKEVELLTGQLGMPTRTEVDASHRKIAELKRALRSRGDGAAAADVAALKAEVAALKRELDALKRTLAASAPAASPVGTSVEAPVPEAVPEAPAVDAVESAAAPATAEAKRPAARRRKGA
jgi:polyhydroxyalkanoate synthesis regulator phasin